MTDIVHVVRVLRLGGYRLKLWFSDGTAGEWDFSELATHETGPMVEPFVSQVLGAELGSVGLCQAGETANTLVWLKPRMTYNSTLQRFNGKVIAEVYSGSGQSLGTYVGESRRDSFLDIVPAYQLDVAYKAAMEDLAAKMKADQHLQTAMKEGAASGDNSTSCAMLPLLPVAHASNPLREIFSK